MTDVIAWPPFGLTGWELAEIYPQSRSVGLIEGRPRTSSAQRARRVASANVAGYGPDQAGAGYVRMLNRMWAGGPQLVRVRCRPWGLQGPRGDLRNTILEWTAAGADLLWTEGGTPVEWRMGEYGANASPATDGVWHGLTVTGLPPSQIVARPGERVTVTGATTEAAYVLKVARTDATGAALVRTDKPEAFTVSGNVVLGDAENIVFEAVNVPRAIKPISGDYGFQWDFREVFEDEYPDGWMEVNPWS